MSIALDAFFDSSLSPQFLQNLLNGIAIPIGVKDPQHRWQLVNRALSQLLEQPVAELLGKTEQTLLRHQVEQSWAEEDRVLAAGDTRVQEEQWTLTTGVSYWLTVQRSLVRDSNGIPYIVVAIQNAREVEAERRATESVTPGSSGGSSDSSSDGSSATSSGVSLEVLSAVLPNVLPEISPDAAFAGLPDVALMGVADDSLTSNSMPATPAWQPLAVALDATREAIAIVQQGHYCYLNRAYIEGLGYAQSEDLLGQPWHSPYGEAERQRFEQEVFPQLADSQPWQGEAMAQRLDGSSFPQDVYLIATNGIVILSYRDITLHKHIETTLRQLNEQLERRVEERTAQMNQLVTRFKQEINDRKHTEASLRESEALFRSIVESANDLIYMISPEGVFSYVSSKWADILGHDPKTIIGQSFVPFVHSGDLLTCFDVLKRVASGEKGHLTEFRAFHQNGSQRWLTANLSPIQDAQGQVLYCLGIARDITEQKQAEAILQEQEQFLRSIYDGVDHSIFVVDVLEDGDLRYAGWNAITERVAGISSREGMNQTPEQVHGPVKGPQVRQRYQQCLAAGATITYEECLTLHNQEDWWLTTLNPLRDSTGRIFRIVGTTFTITARKRAEEERDRFFNLSADILAVTGFDGYFKRVNPAFERILGLTAEELLADPFLSFVHPDDRTATAVEAARIRQGSTVIAFENRYRCKDGSYRWLSWTAVPFIQDGVMYVTARDVTEQKQAEELLRQQEQFLRSIYDNVDNPIFVIDIQSDGEPYYADWNAAAERASGLPKAAIVGQPPEAIYGVEGGQAKRQRLAECIQSGLPLTYEERLVLKGEETWWLTTLNPLRDQAGQIYQVVGTTLNITDRKQAEARVQQQAQDLEAALQTLQRTQMQMVQSEKMSSLGQLVAGVAHEINNPVSFIYGNLAHADDYSRDLLALLALYRIHYPEPVAAIQEKADAIDLEFLTTDLPKLLDSMKMGAERIQKIVASLRTFSRMDEAEMKAVDIHDGIDSTLLILQNRLKAKGRCPEIQVEKHYGALPPVECYAGQLNQVFMNVLSNAIDALEERAEREPHFTPLLTIRTAVVSQKQVAVHIIDNGPGMTAEVQQQLFNPFFTTKPVGKGTGMGMSISYQIVTEKHGGTLRCSSVPDLGSEFTIEIPIAPPFANQPS